MVQENKEEKKVKFNSKGEKNCYHCGEDDHWAPQCPKLSKEKQGKLFLQATDGANVSQATKTGGIKKNRLYLDTCSTEDFVVNPAYVSNIRKAEHPLRLRTNAGTCMATNQGYLGCLKVWLDPIGIANVVSLKSIKAKHRVTYDSELNDGAFVVHTPEGPIQFKTCPDTGFPYIDLDETTMTDNGAMLLQTMPILGNIATSHFMEVPEGSPFIQTVRGNYEGFTKRDIQAAKEARLLQGKLGQISNTELRQLLKEKDKVRHALLRNCPVTTDDLDCAKIIFGPSVDRLKGTSVRTKPIRAEPNYVTIPKEIIDLNPYVTLVADVMFVCGLPFLISMSRRTCFLTLQYLPSRSAGEITSGFQNIINLYNRAGFIPQCAIMDNEFEPLKKSKLAKLLEINTTAKNEHMGEIERKIRHVKNRSRSTKVSLPYKALPKCVIKSMLSNVLM
jgi:hypothetical protein